ncbi:MAG: hypothetical protein LiPW30_164 [Parcubacteria group bacterium LiPW_30]|nr:MAG: hypothetical protein LiPW30_164 [Parcubacteria group bacterium LiPW_30]
MGEEKELVWYTLKMKIFFVLVVIVVSVLSGAIYQQIKSGEVAIDNSFQDGLVAAISTTTQNIYEGLMGPDDSDITTKTYTNSQYGFSIDYYLYSTYPNEKQPLPSYSGAWFAPFFPDTLGNTVVQFPLPMLTNSKPDAFSSNGISIGATKEPSIVATCDSFNLNKNYKTIQKDIGGETFLYLQIIGGSKAGTESIETHYKILKNDICYEIVESVYYTGVSTLDTHDGFLKRAVRLDSMIQSFRFTGSSASNTSTEKEAIQPSVQVGTTKEGYDGTGIIDSVNLIHKKERDYFLNYFLKNKKLETYSFRIKVGGRWGNKIAEDVNIDNTGIRDLITEHVLKYPERELIIVAVEPMGFSIISELPNGQEYCIDTNDFKGIKGKGLFDNFDGWCRYEP